MEISIDARPLDILLVEDSAAEARLVQYALHENNLKCTLNLARDGQEAIDYLKHEQSFQSPSHPDLILLDLNLPVKSGVEVLSEIKTDELLRQIPVIILSSSISDKDITACYRLHANCYITKPQTYDDFVKVIGAIVNYWHTIVKLPSRQMILLNRNQPVIPEDF